MLPQARLRVNAAEAETTQSATPDSISNPAAWSMGKDHTYHFMDDNFMDFLDNFIKTTLW